MYYSAFFMCLCIGVGRPGTLASSPTSGRIIKTNALWSLYCTEYRPTNKVIYRDSFVPTSLAYKK